MTCTMVFCKAGDTKSGKMESRTPGNLKVRFGGRLTHDPSGRSQPIPLNFANLRSANFYSAKLCSADLSSADFSDANLSGARINRNTKFDGVTVNGNTKGLGPWVFNPEKYIIGVWRGAFGNSYASRDRC